MPETTAIPATKPLHAPKTATPSIRRIAGYTYVSTDDEDQAKSYAAQVDYYESDIRTHPGWTFAGIDTEEGISGPTTKHRDGFHQIINDALTGKIDLIVTKSVSRFARNTVDFLTTVRALKDIGVEVFFEQTSEHTIP